MIRFLSRLIKFLVLGFLVLTPILTYNILIDPYGVIRGDMNTQVIEPNKRIIKTKHILNNKSSYNAFLFGSSRVGNIDVSKITDGNRWYNMTYSEGVPSEHLYDLKIFLESGVQCKKVYLGIDEISCFINPDKHEDEALRKRYVNRFNPFTYYLWMLPSYGIHSAIINGRNSEYFTPGQHNFIYTKGSSGRSNKKDGYIERNRQEHKSNEKFRTPYWPHDNDKRNITNSVMALQAFVDYCNNNNIEISVFINPMYHLTYQKAIQEGFQDFLNECNMFTGFYDMNQLEQIGSDEYNYYENSHYRPHIGDTILYYMHEIDSSLFIKVRTLK